MRDDASHLAMCLGQSDADSQTYANAGGSGGFGASVERNGAGGGGAGEVYKFVAGEAHNTVASALTLTDGSYNIVVGQGGARGANTTSSSANGANGTNSTAFGFAALGAAVVCRTSPPDWMADRGADRGRHQRWAGRQ